MANSSYGILAGAIYSGAQWASFFSGKVDEVSGNIVSPTMSGTILMASLPTSNSGLPSGALWNNQGFVCIA